MMAIREEKLLESFLDGAWAERGLSENTLKSYRYDLSQLAIQTTRDTTGAAGPYVAPREP